MTAALAGWVARVRACDIARAGIELQGAPPTSVEAFAREFGVNLGQVTACLQLLVDGPHLLFVGAPVVIAAYSARAGTFRVSFDGEAPPDLASLDIPAAGTWLTVAAAEAGELPAAAPHWAVMTLGPRGPSGINAGAAATLRRYMTDRASLDPFELRTAQAFWACADHCLDGR